MSHRTALVVLALAIAGPARPGFAAPPPERPQTSSPLALGEVLALACDRDLGVVEASRRSVAAGALRLAERARLVPEASVRLAGAYHDLPAFDTASGLGRTIASLPGFPASGAVLDSTIGASWLLFDGFRTTDALTAADLAVEMAACRLDLARREAMASAGAAHLDGVAAASGAALAAAELVHVQALLADVERRRRTGTAAASEVLQARALVADAELATLRAHGDASRARLRLARIVQVGLGARALAETVAVRQVAVPVGAERAAAIAAHPAARLASLGAALAAVRAREPGRALWPTLSATGRFSRRAFEDGWFVGGLEAAWTPFDGLRARHAGEAAEAEAEAQAAAAERVRQELAARLEEALLSRAEARAMRERAAVGLEAAQAAFDLARDRFRRGRVGVLAVAAIREEARRLRAVLAAAGPALAKAELDLALILAAEARDVLKVPAGAPGDGGDRP